jgi:hypothetical protein
MEYAALFGPGSSPGSAHAICATSQCVATQRGAPHGEMENSGGLLAAGREANHRAADARLTPDLPIGVDPGQIYAPPGARRRAVMSARLLPCPLDERGDARPFAQTIHLRLRPAVSEHYGRLAIALSQ